MFDIFLHFFPFKEIMISKTKKKRHFEKAKSIFYSVTNLKFDSFELWLLPNLEAVTYVLDYRNFCEKLWTWDKVTGRKSIIPVPLEDQKTVAYLDFSSVYGIG